MENNCITKCANSDDLELIKNAKISNIFAYAKNISDEEKTSILSYVDRYVARFLNDFKVIWKDGQRCGCYLLREHEDGVLLDEIYLLPQYRRQGIGSNILKNILSEGENVHLCVYKENKKAISLYKKFGFKIEEDKQERYTMCKRQKELTLQ